MRKNKVDEFRFITRRDNCIETAFTVSVGRKTFSSTFADWNNHFDYFRLSLEKSESFTLLEDNDEENMRVELPEYCFSEGGDFYLELYCRNRRAPITGHCDVNQFLRELYQGLLYAALMKCDEYGPSIIWSQFRMEYYNQMKSVVIENHIVGVRNMFRRQTMVSHVLVVGKDGIRNYFDDSNGLWIPLADHMTFLSKNFVSEIPLYIPDVRTRTLRDVALLLREQLPMYIDVWYYDENGKANLIIRPQVEEHGFAPLKGNFTERCARLDLEGIMRWLDHGADIDEALKLVKWTRSQDKDDGVDEDLMSWKDGQREKITAALIKRKEMAG